MSKTRPQRVGEVWVRRGADQTAIFDPVSGRLVQLNATALAIWDLCDGETQDDEIVEALVELTGADRADLERDVRFLLEQLRELGLIDA